MIRFGPVGSVFDFATFAVMRSGCDAGAPDSGPAGLSSRSPETLIVLMIRTRVLLSESSVEAAAGVGSHRRDRRRPDPSEPLNDTLGSHRLFHASSQCSSPS